MLPEHRRDEQGCLQTTLLRTQKSHTLEQCVPPVPSYGYLVSHLSPPIYLFLPSYGDLVFHHTLSLSAVFSKDDIPPSLSLCQAMDPWSLTPRPPSLPSYAPLYVPCKGHNNVFPCTGLERKAVANADVTGWRVTPQLHFMQELIEHQCLETGAPCQCWTYKDESGGAWLGKVAMKRGAKTVASSLAVSVINRFRYRLHQQKR